MDEIQPSDTEVLLDFKEIAGFKIRPWRFLECVAMAPVIEQIQINLKNRKLTFRDFFDITKDADGKDVVCVINIDQLAFSFIPLLPEILSNINHRQMLDIASTIFVQNFEYLKNSFALIAEGAKILRGKNS